jgi:hypothetical protein
MTLTLLLPGLPARADDLSGHVIVVGSSVNMRVQLTEKEGSKGPALCPNDVSKRIRKLLRLEVSVTGAWQMKKDGSSKDCFAATGFKILKHSSGRDPIIGMLQDQGAYFIVKGDDGKVSKLSEVTSGLKSLKGKKVILDLKPMDSPGQKDVSYKVVAYSEFPE